MEQLSNANGLAVWYPCDTMHGSAEAAAVVLQVCRRPIGLVAISSV